jgi:hypothetical protein
LLRAVTPQPLGVFAVALALAQLPVKEAFYTQGGCVRPLARPARAGDRPGPGSTSPSLP